MLSVPSRPSSPQQPAEGQHISDPVAAGPFEEIGYLCAGLLDRMMDGERVPQPPYLTPLGVVARPSTDVMAVKDPLVADAPVFIRENAPRPMDVRDIVSRLLVSRRRLERHFVAAIGRSPAEELLRVRIENAKRVLQQTDLNVAEVAQKAGFANSARLTEALLRTTQVSPAAYRKKTHREIMHHH